MRYKQAKLCGGYDLLTPSKLYFFAGLRSHMLTLVLACTIAGKYVN